MCVCVYACIYACSVTQLCPTFCSPRDCSLPGFSVHGTVPARKLEEAISFFRDLPDPGIKPTSPASPASASAFYTTVLPGKPIN